MLDRIGGNGELAGMRACVLGSTSGIGRAVALALAEAGADVLVHGRRSRQVAEEIVAHCGKFGVRSEVLMADLADRAAGDRLAAEAWEHWGGLDAWLQIAGADVLTGGDARRSFDEKLDRLLAVDLVATMRALPRRGDAYEGRWRRVDCHDGLGPGRDRHGG